MSCDLKTAAKTTTTIIIRTKIPFPHLFFLLSLTIYFLEPACAIRFRVCLCVWLVSTLSLFSLLHGTPLSSLLFTDLFAHSNWTIMQSVWSTTLHDSATIIALLQLTTDCLLSCCCYYCVSVWRLYSVCLHICSCRVWYPGLVLQLLFVLW